MRIAWLTLSQRVRELNAVRKKAGDVTVKACANYVKRHGAPEKLGIFIAVYEYDDDLDECPFMLDWEEEEEIETDE